MGGEERKGRGGEKMKGGEKRKFLAFGTRDSIGVEVLALQVNDLGSVFSTT